MCGIAGIWFANKNKKIDQVLLERMTEVISHRGPDDKGHYINQNVGLGFRRLSIIDLMHGHQPMCDVRRRVWIVFNGEIYNYKSLKLELINRGYLFKNESDTEVILNAYLEYGEEFVHQLRGMFSFALWDKENDLMILCRDRFGIKPIYYSLNNNRLVFASEIKSILKTNLANTELDYQAIDSYFSYGYILSPLSIYKDIKKLSPGHLLIIKREDVVFRSEIKRYWRPVFSEDSSISIDDYKILLIKKLEDSIRAHLVSDVPIGAFLSGGIDSNAVVSMMVNLYPDKVKTFSIGFDDVRYNEAIVASKSANLYGTEHYELYLQPESVNMIEKIVDMYDEPFADSSAIPNYIVSRLASQYVKVVLSGDGGDEFFGGYTLYQRYLKIQKYKSLIRFGKPLLRLISDLMPDNLKGKRFLSSLTHDPDVYFAYTMQVYEREKKSFFHPDIYNTIMQNKAVDIKLLHYYSSNTSDYSSRMMEMDISTYMVDDILTKVDRVSMANSLEVRVPIIDHEFYNLAAQIPSYMKINGSTGKYIFREAMREYIPDQVYNKPKTGFTIPIAQWFKKNLSDYFVDILTNHNDNGIINPEYIKNILQYKKLGSFSTRVWPIVIFIIWLENIYKKKTN